MPTNLTFMENASAPDQVIEGVIQSTNGGFVIGLMLSLFIIVAVALKAKGKDFDEIFIYTGAFEFIISVLAIAGQYIEFYWIMFPVTLLFTGIMISVFANRN